MKPTLNPSQPLIKALILHYLKAVDRDRGFTLLEALVAMFIITIILSFIAGPIVLTAGTRVKNQDTEQSLNLAQSYVEQTRITLAQVSSWTDPDLNPLPTGTNITAGPGGIPYSADSTLGAANTTDITAVPAPTAICGPASLLGTANTCNVYTEMLAVDYDQDPNDNQKVDFYVQVFRLNDIDDDTVATADEIMGFDIGVRVYSDLAAATLTDGNAATVLTTTPMSSSMTSGLLSATQPITVYYTSLYRSENSQALGTFNSCTIPNYESKPVTNNTGVKAAIEADGFQDAGESLGPGAAATPTKTAGVVAGSQSPAPGTKKICGSAISYKFYY